VTEEPVNTYVLYESKRLYVGQRGQGRQMLTYLAQFASYIDVQKDYDRVKEISSKRHEELDKVELIDGIKSPEPSVNSVLDVSGELAR
jgi:hypothetical protein